MKSQTITDRLTTLHTLAQTELKFKVNKLLYNKPGTLYLAQNDSMQFDKDYDFHGVNVEGVVAFLSKSGTTTLLPMSSLPIQDLLFVLRELEEGNFLFNPIEP